MKFNRSSLHWTWNLKIPDLLHQVMVFCPLANGSQIYAAMWCVTQSSSCRRKMCFIWIGNFLPSNENPQQSRDNQDCCSFIMKERSWSYCKVAWWSHWQPGHGSIWKAKSLMCYNYNNWQHPWALRACSTIVRISLQCDIMTLTEMNTDLYFFVPLHVMPFTSKHLKACLGPALVTVLDRRGPPWHSVSHGFGPEGAPLALR